MQIPLTLPKLAAAFFFLNLLIFWYLIRRYNRKKHFLQSDIQGLQERVNLLNAENEKEALNTKALEQKIRRYHSLKQITEEIDRSLELENIGESVSYIVFSFIAKNKGSCIFYLIDNHSQKPALFKAKKENPDLIIKAKEGDILDFWVLRHASPLLIEDMRRDFRFDPARIENQHLRPVLSLISSPLVSEQKFLGILRLDNPLPNAYSQDDLRFLTAVCDLAAVAVENGQLFQRTRDLAIHDELTSLYTKAYFIERLSEECKRGMRQEASFSLLMMDIDHFKEYNDTFGHTCGDIVLKNLSHNMKSFFESYNAVVCRFGGEEFCAILPACDKDKAYRIAEEFRKNVAKAGIVLRKKETHIAVSIGVASFPQDAREAEELVLKADKAMYRAKQEGRNRVCKA